MPQRFASLVKDTPHIIRRGLIAHLVIPFEGFLDDDGCGLTRHCSGLVVQVRRNTWFDLIPEFLIKAKEEAKDED